MFKQSPKLKHLWFLLLFALSTTIYGQNVEKDVSNLKNTTKYLEDTVSGLGRTQNGLQNALHKTDENLGKVNKTAINANNTADSALITAAKAEKNNYDTKSFLDRFWVLLAAVLVFFMQAGFKCLEVGVARRKHDAGTAIMNLMNWLILCLIFYFVGYGIMFGNSFDGVIGVVKDWRAPQQDVFDLYKPLGVEHFLFQLAFAATAATIVDGAILERTDIRGYFCITIIIGLFIYPVFGHWAWNNSGWLKKIKFQDFAGSTVVHSVGAWTALVAVLFIGRRLYRFNDKAPENQKNKFESYSLGYSVLGVIMLWFGWWGFNGGSQLKYDDSIASIILNTNLAGASAGIIAFFDAFVRDRSRVNAKTIGGVLGGLVAITASCNVVDPVGATIIGILSGYAHNIAFDLLGKWKIDDTAGAIPVHGACGALGTLLAGIIPFWLPSQVLSDSIKNKHSLLNDSMGQQILIQLLGIATAFVFTCIVAFVFFWLINRMIGLRTSISEEDAEDGRNDELRGPYAGPLQVSLRRVWNNWSFAWTRFKPWEVFLNETRNNAHWTDFVERVNNLNQNNRDTLLKEFLDLQEKRFQFIREDDTNATFDDIRLALIKKRTVFVCYRQSDSYNEAQFIHAQLSGRYGDSVFIDAGVQIGDNIPNEIDVILRHFCKVFIVVIGKKWSDILQEKLRTPDEDDFVQQEIALALTNPNIKVLQVLVQNAKVPANLPESISALADKQALMSGENIAPHFWQNLFNVVDKKVR